jgi:hypothetical protein
MLSIVDFTFFVLHVNASFAIFGRRPTSTGFYQRSKTKNPSFAKNGSALDFCIFCGCKLASFCSVGFYWSMIHVPMSPFILLQANRE